VPKANADCSETSAFVTVESVVPWASLITALLKYFSPYLSLTVGILASEQTTVAKRISFA